MEVALGRSLATGNTAEIFEWGSRVIKLYKSPAAKPAAFREAATSAAVEALGLPVPKVWNVHEVGDRWGLVVFDRVAHKSFAAQMLDKMNDVFRYLKRMVQLQIRIHSHQVTQFAGLKVTLTANITASVLLDSPCKQGLLNGIAGMPDGDRLCHGDFHPLNILGGTSDPVIIDWLDARRGDPAADVCRSYLLLKLHAAEIATAYPDTYCSLGEIDRDTVLRWLPYVAAAKLAEGVPGERDGLRKSSTRRRQPDPHRGSGSAAASAPLPPVQPSRMHPRHGRLTPVSCRLAAARTSAAVGHDRTCGPQGFLLNVQGRRRCLELSLSRPPSC